MQRIWHSCIADLPQATRAAFEKMAPKDTIQAFELANFWQLFILLTLKSTVNISDTRAPRNSQV